MNKIEKTCKECNCKHFIVWSFGFGDMYSCELQGQSEHIESVAKDCPFKSLSKLRILIANKNKH